MSGADAWLESRCAQVPPALAARVRVAVAAAEGARAQSTAPLETLVDAAVACITDALEQGGRREAADPLLAADALLTWACEAAIEAGDGALDGLTIEVSRRLSTRQGDAGT